MWFKCNKWGTGCSLLLREKKCCFKQHSLSILTNRIKSCCKVVFWKMKSDKRSQPIRLSFNYPAVSAVDSTNRQVFYLWIYIATRVDLIFSNNQTLSSGRFNIVNLSLQWCAAVSPLSIFYWYVVYFLLGFSRLKLEPRFSRGRGPMRYNLIDQSFRITAEYTMRYRCFAEARRFGRIHFICVNMSRYRSNRTIKIHRANVQREYRWCDLSLSQPSSAFSYSWVTFAVSSSSRTWKVQCRRTELSENLPLQRLSFWSMIILVEIRMEWCFMEVGVLLSSVPLITLSFLYASVRLYDIDFYVVSCESSDWRGQNRDCG